jgi:hypothetical protein
MRIYSYAEGRSDLPSDFDDGDEIDGNDVEEEDDEDGGEETYGGRIVAEAIGHMLRDLGYRVDGPICVDDHGWDLDVFVGGRRIWVEVQGGSDEFWLQTEAMVGLFGRLFRPDISHYREFMQRLSDGLRAHPAFTEIKWYATRAGRSVGPPLDAPPAAQ